ncbi:MAG: YchF/TatD family DNA exonuclease [Enterobacteriaceae bacterium]
MFLVDSHCHLDRLNYRDQHQSVEQVMAQAKLRDVGFVLAVATTLEQFSEMVAMIGPRKDVAYSCGVHPLHLEQPYDEALLATLAARQDVVALGETGLDYFYQPQTIELQQTSLRTHIRLGRQLGKPVIVHCRDAAPDVLTILRSEQAQECGGVLHCYTENEATARELLDLGFYISFSGIVTFRNADELRAVARMIPLDRMLLETDAPWLTPVPHRGKENQPAYVRDIAEYLAALKGISVQELARITTENFIRLFAPPNLQI